MKPEDFSSPEWPRWVSGLGFYIMSEDGEDGSGWSESKTYFVNLDTKTDLWTLTIATTTKQKEEDGFESEEADEETIGPHKLEEFREVLATYDFKLDDDMVSEITKRLNNKHLL